MLRSRSWASEAGRRPPGWMDDDAAGLGTVGSQGAAMKAQSSLRP